MLEVEYRIRHASRTGLEEWEPIVRWGNDNRYFFGITPEDLNDYDFRINGVVYTEWNNELAKIMAWEKLING
jgi:hypothetical protein